MKKLNKLTLCDCLCSLSQRLSATASCTKGMQLRKLILCFVTLVTILSFRSEDKNKRISSGMYNHAKANSHGKLYLNYGNSSVGLSKDQKFWPLDTTTVPIFSYNYSYPGRADYFDVWLYNTSTYQYYYFQVPPYCTPTESIGRVPAGIYDITINCTTSSTNDYSYYAGCNLRKDGQGSIFFESVSIDSNCNTVEMH
jgi:hypothetical protein